MPSKAEVPSSNEPALYEEALEAKSQGPRIEMQTGVREIERVIAVECRGWGRVPPNDLYRILYEEASFSRQYRSRHRDSVHLPQI